MTARAQGESAADRAYRWLRARILNGTFAGGRLLSEGEVADAVQVSRTPVREAFLQLAAEDMLELYPKRGALVVSVSAAELREVLVARTLLEPWAAGLVAGRPDRTAVAAALRSVTEAARQALDGHDEEGFQEADRQFHQQLLVAAGNQLLAAFYASLRDRQLRGGMMAVYNDPARGAESMAQHDSIAAAIEAGDADAAAAVMTEHLNGTAGALGLAPLA
ncbi:MAG TPA: GntR family transcriptional regulator [Solirubrobacteraceae bacterium]|nr:GntR family transcriptional regulator [Solirubrobacteraceae bacterium]